MASFSTLPIELQRLIVDCFTDRDKRHVLASLAATSRRNHWLFNGILYHADIDRGPSRAMIWAAVTGNIRILELAVAHGADVNYTYHLRHNNTDDMELLHSVSGILPRKILDPASVPTGHPLRGTALHFATITGRDEAVEWLVDHGARLDIGATNLCGCHMRFGHRTWYFPTQSSPDLYPLHFALCYEKASTFRTLIRKGALMDMTCEGQTRVDGTAHDSDELYPTSLHQAVYVGNREIFDFILDWPNSATESQARVTTTVTGLSTLELTYLGSGLGSREDRAYITRKLVQHGARLPEDSDVLLRACKYGAFGTAINLLESGACPPLRSEPSAEMLYHALRDRPTKREYLDDENSVDKAFLTVPDFRVCDRLDLVRLLFKAGADPNKGRSAEGADDRIPLMTAADPAHPPHVALELVKLIHEQGVDPGFTDSCGQTVLHYLVDEVLTHNASYEPEEFLPRYSAPLEVVQYLVKEVGVRIDTPDRRGLTVFDHIYVGISWYGDEECNEPHCHVWWRYAVGLAECILNNARHPLAPEMAAKEAARLQDAKRKLEDAEYRAERRERELMKNAVYDSEDIDYLWC